MHAVGKLQSQRVRARSGLEGRFCLSLPKVEMVFIHGNHLAFCDRSFVQNLAVHSDSRAIVRSVTGMGHVLQVDVFAEGVETEGQLHALRDIGTDGAQGYLFARPMSHRAFVQALASACVMPLALKG